MSRLKHKLCAKECMFATVYHFKCPQASFMTHVNIPNALLNPTE